MCEKKISALLYYCTSFPPAPQEEKYSPTWVRVQGTEEAPLLAGKGRCVKRFNIKYAFLLCSKGRFGKLIQG